MCSFRQSIPEFGDSILLLKDLGICRVVAEPKPVFGAGKASLLPSENVGGGDVISSCESHDKSSAVFMFSVIS